MIAKLKQVRKALVGVATLATNALTLGLLPDPAGVYAVLVVDALAVFGIYALSNDPPEAGPDN